MAKVPGQPLLMGIRMEQCESEDEFENAFTDDSSLSLDLPIQTPRLEQNALPKIQQATEIDEIKSFQDVSSFLTSLCSALAEYSVPDHVPDDIDLIPFGTTPESVLNGVSIFIQTRNSQEYLTFLDNLDRTDLSESLECQLEILKYSFDPSANIESFDGKKLDSRLCSLLFWLLSSKLKDTALGKSSAYCLKSALEYVKNTTLAPIAVVFPDFTLSSVLTRLCEMLIKLFPSHPIIPSYLYRLAEFTNSKDAIISLIPDDNFAEDDDSDFSSSFFDDLKPMANQGGAVLSLNDNTETNPLELATFRPTDVVVLRDPPDTMTYAIGDKKEQMTPNEFVEWVTHNRSNARTELPVDTWGVQSQPVLPRMSIIHDLKEVRDPKAFDALYGLADADVLVNMLPEQCDGTSWCLFLPLLHFLCAKSKGVFSKRAPDSRLLNLEYEAHHGIMQNCSDSVNRCLQQLSENIPKDLPIDETNCAPLKTKRALPEHFSAYGEKEVIAQSLVDLIVLLDGRSPLTFVSSQEVHRDLLVREDHPVFGKLWRTAALFRLYCENSFPPYLTFRCAFALGLCIAEVNRGIACRFFFEGLYVLLEMLPSMRDFVAVKTAFFVFGEAMDASGDPFYCALLQDNASSLIIQDKRMASKAAHIAHKNKDSCRAVFYYLNALKLYRDMKNNEEALYTAQIVASIYRENGQIMEGIQLLNDILMNVYHLDDNENSASKMSQEYLEGVKRSKLAKSKANRRAKSFKTLPMGKAERGQKPDAVNTILAAVFLCNLLIKARLFSTATSVAEHVLNMISLPTMTRIVDFMNAKVDFYRNDFASFVQHITNMKIFHLGMVPAIRLGSHPQNFVDVASDSLKLLAKGYFQRGDAVKSFFWSEMLCHYASAMSSLKGLATGLHLRGMSLGCLYKHHHLWTHGVVLTAPLDDLQATIGSFKSSTRTLSRDDLLSEALSSFLQARLVSDRIGRGTRILSGYLQYGILLGLFMLARKFLDKETRGFQLVIDLPTFETEMRNTNVRESLIAVERLVLTNSNALDHLAQIRLSINQMSKVFMNPIAVIQAEILSCMVCVLQDEKEDAENVFNFAFQNLSKYFFNGHACIVKDFELLHLIELREDLRCLLLLLLTFEKDFINGHLVLFDMLNELVGFIRKRLGATTPDAFKAILPRSDVQPSIDQLVNPIYPDFSSVLSENGVGPSSMGGFSPRSSGRKTTIKSLLSMIKRNINLYYEGQLGERKLFDLNALLCKRAESIANELRKNRTSLILTEMSPRLTEAVIFMVSIYGHIVSYIPSQGTMKTTKMHVGNKQTLDVAVMSHPVKVSCGSSVFPSQFLQNIFETICTDSPMKKPKSGSVGFNDSVEVLGKILFGDISAFLKKFTLTGIRDDPWDTKTTKDKKGRLRVLSLTSVPLQIVADSTLHALPFELLFPRCAVVRSVGFFNTYGRFQSNSSVRPLVVRWRLDKEREAAVCVKRSTDLIHSAVKMLGAGFTPLEYVGDFEQYITFPSPLFDASRDTEKYAKDYPFCDFAQLQRSDRLDSITNGIFIFTYSDLVDWPCFLDEVTQKMPHAWYLFIPSSHMTQAFTELKAIFKRHERRKAFFEANPNAPKAEENMKPFKSQFQFVMTIQLSLIKKLKVPVAVLNPTGNLIS